MSVSTGSESQIQPNRAQVGLYASSKKYVSELTVQGHISSPAKGLLANENSPGDPIQNVGSVVRMNDRAHAHLISQPQSSRKALPAAHGATKSPQAGAGGAEVSS